MAGTDPHRTCAQLTNFGGAIMRQRMHRHLHSRAGCGFKNQKCVIYGSRDPKSRLWRVDLKQRFETNQVQCNHAHDNNNQKYLINYLHAACFSPVKSTWITAIKNGNFSPWPGLTEHVVERHLSKSTSTTKGHLNQQRQNARTIKTWTPRKLSQNLT
jgi:hypothetical protein